MGQKKKKSKRVRKTVLKETVTQRLAQRLRPLQDDLLEADLSDPEPPPEAEKPPANASDAPQGGDEPHEGLATPSGTTAKSEDDGILSPELAAELQANNSNSELVLSQKKPNKQKLRQQRQEKTVKLSKSQQRKLRKLEEIKALRTQRVADLSVLQKHQLSDDSISLLLSTSTIGKGMSVKEKLRRALLREKAGLSNLPLVGDEAGKAVRLREARSMERSDSFDNIQLPENTPSHPPTLVPPSALVQASNTWTADGSPSSLEAATPLHDTTPVRKGTKRKQAKAADQGCVRAKAGEEARKRGMKDPQQSQKEAKPATACVVHVARDPDIQAARQELPIASMEQEVMEAVAHNSTIVVCGETGSGKTTQLPQFLYEAGYGCADFPMRSGMIAVTQPRRVAVLSTARRVAVELGVPIGDEVGYQVRYERAMSPATRIKFMTDGILLREVQQDFLLKKYSVIIIDEAHERSVNTDILLGLLSRIVPLREKHAARDPDSVRPLKLIVMSATLRVEDFVSNQLLFPRPPPVVNVPARQYPVTIHFSRRTELLDYVGEACNKAIKVHEKLPAGAILIFVTGRQEVERACRRLRQRAKQTDRKGGPREEEEDPKGVGEHERNKAPDTSETTFEAGVGNFDVDAREEDEGYEADAAAGENSEQESLEGEGEGEEMFSDDDTEGDKSGASTVPDTSFVEDKTSKPSKLLVLPLYAMLPAEAQLRVFKEPPEGCRLCVVATNVAETSLTIPGVRYVIDCGRAKERVYHRSAGSASFQVEWISKASAQQRAGRAGRTGPGHVYRLFSSAHFNDNFNEFALPEIRRVPIDGVVLQLKALGIDKVSNFPFPSSPDPEALEEGQRVLNAIGALRKEDGLLTPLGRQMARFPVNPRHARLLLHAVSEGGHKSVGQAVRTAAVMSVDTPFLSEVPECEQTRNGRRSRQDEEQGQDPHGDETAKEDGDLRRGKDILDPKAAMRAEEDAEKAAEEARKEEKKRRMQVARQKQAQFLDRESDVISAVNALYAFEQVQGSRNKWCRNHALRMKSLVEAQMLTQQLMRVLESTQPDYSSTDAVRDVRWPPSKRQRQILHRAFLAGWADKVARRVRVKDIVSRQGEGDDWHHNSKAIRYRSAEADGFVYMHPRSGLAKLAPEYVSYGEILQTTRPYMRNVSICEPEWLPSLSEYHTTLSKPLEDPAPWYDSRLDETRCFKQPSFGAHLWQLPLHATQYDDKNGKYLVFAAALLNGKVVRSFAQLRGSLAAAPASMIRNEGLALPRVHSLLRELKRARVCSRKALLSAWKEEPSYLRDEVALWIKNCDRPQLLAVWQELVDLALRSCSD